MKAIWLNTLQIELSAEQAVALRKFLERFKAEPEGSFIEELYTLLTDCGV